MEEAIFVLLKPVGAVTRFILQTIYNLDKSHAKRNTSPHSLLYMVGSTCSPSCRRESVRKVLLDASG